MTVRPSLLGASLQRLRRWVLYPGAVATALFVGCSGGDDTAPSFTPDGGSTGVCTDSDGDGFGAGCPSGGDCDDGNASVTNECYRCQTPNDGCDCGPEGAVVACGEEISRDGFVVTCSQGERTCSGGKWGNCLPKTMSTRSLAPGLGAQGTATTATACINNPCDPYCQSYGNGTPPGLGGGATTGPGGITLTSTAVTNPPPTCGTQNKKAKRIPLGMVLMVDASGSMCQPGTIGSGNPACATPTATSKWTKTVNGITTFIGDASLGGMHAGLDFFPHVDSDEADRCNDAFYRGGNMTVGMGVLPGVAASITSALAAKKPWGATPMLAGLNGALREANDWALGDVAAGRKGIAVLVTDGLPSECGVCFGNSKKDAKQTAACAVQQVADLAESFFYPPVGNTSVETFVIGVQTDSSDTNLRYLNTIARAGSGGKRDAILIDASASSSTAISDALKAIRDQSLSCDFAIPPPTSGVVDPNATTVSLALASGTLNLTKVATPGACGTGDGFYYDVNGPKIRLCPTTCDKAKADIDADINITYTCVQSCASASTQVQPDPIDVLVMMDRSGSMDEEISGTGTTKWAAVTASMRAFVRSPDSAGMGLGISYFPPPTACGDCYRCSGFFGCTKNNSFYPFCDGYDNKQTNLTTCEGDTFGRSSPESRYYVDNSTTCTDAEFMNLGVTKGVSIATLPGAANTQSNAIIASMAAMSPDGATPTPPALRSAIAAAQARQTSTGRKTAVLLVTDGNPTTCGSTPQSESVTAATNGFTAANSVSTFVLGVNTGTAGTGFTANMNAIQNAGTGARFPTAFITDGTDPSDLIDALNAIRRRATSCNFNIPTPPVGQLDLSNPAVSLASGSPTTVTNLPRAANLGACGATNSYYFDNATTPTEIRLCPTPCTTLQSDPNARIDLVYQCLNQYGAGDAIYEYDTRNVCPRGTKPFWANWSWQSTTPTGTKIEFFVTTGDFSGSTPVNLSTETALRFSRPAINTQLACSSLPSTCAAGLTVDTQNVGQLASLPGDVIVDDTLRLAGIPRDRPYLKIRARLNPSSDLLRTPTLSNIDLQVSCRPGE